MYRRRPTIRVSFAAALLLWSLWGSGGRAAEDDHRAAVVLRHAALTESSGVAVSRRQPDRLWTHNDSGDSARLFAFDSQGRSTGVWQLLETTAVDWEDLASFEVDGRQKLLVADVGDNLARRSEVQLLLLDEPDPDGSGVVTDVQTIRVRFPDGPCDCEAVAVDVAAKQIWLATKRRLPICDLFVVPLKAAPQPVTARFVTRVAMPMVTAMDIDADARSMVLGGYFDAFVYRKRTLDESWRDALQRTPQHRILPPLKQIEAICFGNEHKIWVTSEGTPARLMQLTITDK